MTRLIILVGVLIVIAAPPAEAQRVDPAATDSPVTLREVASRAAGELPVQAAPARPQPEPPPPPPRPRRRGSMVGYIEDPVIESKIRVRFELSKETTVPDRAEFFYAKCGCYRDLAAADPARDPNAPGPRPGAANDLDFQQLYIFGEYAVSPRFSAFGQLPFRWLQPRAFIPGTGAGFPDQSGLADIRAGVRAGLVASDEQSVTAQVKLLIPTGEATRGLGTDHTSLEPALLYRQAVNDIVSVESQFGVRLPLEGAAPVPTAADGTFAGDVLFYGIGPSISVYRSDRVQVAPVVELVGWRVLNGYQTAADADASGVNIANLKLGARTVFAQGSIYAGYGFALTEESWYDDVFRVEYRYGF